MEHIRRATLDDLEALRKLWAPLGFNLVDLEKHLTEFQVAETADGKFLGAVGFMMLNSQGLIHHEAYIESADSQLLRVLFWKRLQVLTSNHGVLRLWVRENAQDWSALGFQPPAGDALERLPEFWDRSLPGWHTLQLKDEDVMAKMDKEMALFMTAEKQRTERLMKGAQVFRKVAIIIGFLAAFLFVGAALWIFIARKTGHVTPPQP